MMHGQTNINYRVRLIMMLHAFAERTEQVSDTTVLITYFMMQTPSTKFCLHLLINYRVQTRVKKTHTIHTQPFSLRVYLTHCVHTTHTNISKVELYGNEVKQICN